MVCLSDIELQAVADGEAGETAVSHVAGCRACRDRVEAIQRTLASVAATMKASDDIPAATAARVREAIGSGDRIRGATALRSGGPSTSSRAGIISALATAAAIAIVVFGVL